MLEKQKVGPQPQKSFRKFANMVQHIILTFDLLLFILATVNHPEQP